MNGTPRRWLRATATLLLMAGLISGCGGGSSSLGDNATAPTGSNVVAMTVDSGPQAANGGAFNIPSASVTVCTPSGTCAVIDHVLVDTGSTGLRLMASALSAAGLSFTPTADPNNASATIAECLPFADGYTWGPVTTAQVKMGGEIASSVSINIIDDNDSYLSSAPTDCQSYGASLNSVAAFAANGVLGVGVFAQDCGTSCGDCATACTSVNDIYYSCAASTNSCAETPVALSAQVTNPVYAFAADNNGVVLKLPSIPASGAATASGYLIFGIGTESNNGLGGATVLTTDDVGNISSSFNGQLLTAFVDSGSNGYFFPDSSITTCPSDGSNDDASSFYCPSSTLSLSATNQGLNGATATVTFQIANLNNISGSDYAIDDVGGIDVGTVSGGTGFFDWGLPFFYGRSVYTAIEGQAAGSATGPYVAF